MIHTNANLTEQLKVVNAFAHAVPTGASPAWVSLKHYQRATIMLPVVNGGTVTTPVAVTVQQATAIAGTGAKPLAFTKVYRNVDTAAGDTLTEVAVSNNTFTMDNTVSKNQLYAIEIKADDLDVNNNFDCIQVALANGTGQSVAAQYLLWPARYQKLATPTAVAD